MKYYINYGTGAGNEWVDGDLDTVKQVADKHCCYTQACIRIYDEQLNFVCMRPWVGSQIDMDDFNSDPIPIGCGYFADWQEYDM